MRIQPTKTMVTFQRGFLKQQVGRMNNTAIGRASAYTMRVARKSIRRRKNRNRPSPVGTPPYSHVAGALPPFKRIGFVVRFGQGIIGMEGFGGKGPPVPGLQEHGGGAQRKVYRKVGRRTLKRNFSQPRQGGVITRKVNTGVRYKPRPFMMPALAVTIPKLPQFWANSLR